MKIQWTTRRYLVINTANFLNGSGSNLKSAREAALFLSPALNIVFPRSNLFIFLKPLNMQFKNYVFLQLILIFSTCVSAQKLDLQLSWQPANDSFPVTSTFFIGNIKDTQPKLPIFLKNKDTVVRYEIFKMAISVPPNKSKYDSIFLLVGSKNNQLLMVSDNNRNGSFSDDSVYSMSLDRKAKTEKEFRNNLPLVCIDSVLLVDQEGTAHFTDLHICFSPSSRLYDFISDSSQISKTKNISLTLYHGGRFTTTFSIKGQEYNIYLIPNVLTLPYYPVLNSKFSKSAFWISKHRFENTGRSEKGLFASVLEVIIDKKTPVPFDNMEMKIIKADIKNRQLTVQIVSAFAKKDKISIQRLQTGKYYSLKSEKELSFSLSKKPYTLIEFTGSWCKPCQQILSQVKELYSNLPSSVQFISVQAEKSLEIAQTYFRRFPTPFESIYEELGCAKPTCFQNTFQVNIFPTFILIDNKGNILLKERGDAALEKIRQALKQINQQQ